MLVDPGAATDNLERLKNLWTGRATMGFYESIDFSRESRKETATAAW